MSALASCINPDSYLLTILCAYCIPCVNNFYALCLREHTSELRLHVSESLGEAELQR